MRPVMQTRFGTRPCGWWTGNCFSASVASILELPLSCVPTFAMHKNWYDRFRDWSALRGFAIFTVNPTDKNRAWLEEAVRGVYHLMSGPASQGCYHTVVGRGGKMVHDPHPSGEGLTKCEEWELFVPFQPRTVQPPFCKEEE